MDCLGLASIQATQSGLIEVNGEKIPALRGNRLSDGQPLTVYPGEVPAGCRVRRSGNSRGFSLRISVRR
jgi:predicted YcjX-like family ATPase